MFISCGSQQLEFLIVRPQRVDLYFFAVRHLEMQLGMSSLNFFKYSAFLAAQGAVLEDDCRVILALIGL